MHPNKSLKTHSKNLLLAGNVELNFVNKQAVTTTTRKLLRRKKLVSKIIVNIV